MAKNNVFKRGYKYAREEVERQERARENAGKLLYEFYLPKPDKSNREPEADVIFLTDEPVNFYMHQVPRQGGRYDSVVCSEEITGNCPCCEEGNKPSYKGAYLIYDERPYEYTDSKGKKIKKKGQLRLYFAGVKVMSQLDRINSRKGGLLNRECTIVRTGTGTSTSYTIEVGEELDLTRKELANLFADAHEDIRDMFDGSVESMYSIIEEQLKLRMQSDEDIEDDEDDEDEEDYDKNLVGDEDDDDGEDYEDYEDEDDEDDEDEEPVRRRSSGKKTLFKKPAVKKTRRRR